MCWGPDKRGAHGGNKHRKTEIKQEILVVAVLLFVPVGTRIGSFIQAPLHEFLLIKSPLPEQTLTPVFVSCSQRP